MVDMNSSGPIPDGWKLKNEVQKGGSKNLVYWCPATGQHFFTYEDMMQYVDYAKEAKVSFYSPDFGKKKAGLLARRTKRGFAARRRQYLAGQSSKPLTLKPAALSPPVKENNDLKESSDPEDSNDKGVNIKSDEAGLKAGPEPDIGWLNVKDDEAGVKAGPEPDIGGLNIKDDEAGVKEGQEPSNGPENMLVQRDALSA